MMVLYQTRTTIHLRYHEGLEKGGYGGFENKYMSSMNQPYDEKYEKCIKWTILQCCHSERHLSCSHFSFLYLLLVAEVKGVWSLFQQASRKKSREHPEQVATALMQLGCQCRWRSWKKKTGNAGSSSKKLTLPQRLLQLLLSRI